jgi:hypothetical protein
VSKSSFVHTAAPLELGQTLDRNAPVAAPADPSSRLQAVRRSTPAIGYFYPARCCHLLA